MAPQSTSDEIDPGNLIRQASLEWVEEILSALRAEGRPVEGGWPGTLSEAHRRSRHIARAMEIAPKSPQLSQLAHTLSRSAKQLWLSHVKQHLQTKTLRDEDD
jgi:hypothetical protein